MFISNPIFIILAGTGAVFIVVGLLVLKNPPRKINDLFGYRTKRSKKSQDHWDFAQRHSSRVMMKIGQVLAIISVPATFINVGPSAGSALAAIIVVAVSIYLIINTEQAIKNRFDVDN